MSVDRSIPSGRDQVDIVTLELLLGIVGDGLGVGIQNMFARLDDVDRDLLSADLRVVVDNIFQTQIVDLL